MKKISKRNKKNIKIFIKKKIYKIKDGIKILKKFVPTKFTESVDLACQLSINSKKSEQNIRNTVILPHGTGKKITIAVFTSPENQKKALKIGADFSGMESILDIIKKKKKKIDYVLATPDAMQFIKNLGLILGPKGFMPNKKDGTITDNLKNTIQELRKGKIKCRNDKYGIIHSTFGKINFSTTQLYENLLFLLQHIKNSKPPQLKGFYFKKISLSTTMSPSIIVNHISL
ncbi:50S ribosomal protein L1 [Buchnera aphidicola]|uniref:50S ribosomal protein L1 n=1 Tax=Buchnera aphidicola TaxID=9 RepID=UPI0031B704FC